MTVPSWHPVIPEHEFGGVGVTPARMAAFDALGGTGIMVWLCGPNGWTAPRNDGTMWHAMQRLAPVPTGSTGWNVCVLTAASLGNPRAA
jgi:hypothetical protein